MILSTTRKIQTIADLLSGRPPNVNPTHLDPPWLDYYRWVQSWIAEDPDDVDLVRLRLDFFNYCHQNGNGVDSSNYEFIMAAVEHPVTYQSVECFLQDLPDLEWLWPDWLPLGMLSIFAASPGTGKSYVSLDLAHRIISADQFPDGQPVMESGRVLWVDAENTPAIYKQRLSVWPAAHRQRLFYMQPDPDRIVINLDDDRDRDRLLDHICVIHPVLTVVDSYGSATLRGDRNKEDVQDLLAFLTQVAADHRGSMLLVHHLRKRSNAQDTFLPMNLDSIRGSGHIAAMARNILGMQFGHSSDRNGPRRLWVLKSNIGQYPDALGVVFKPHPLDPKIAQIEYGEAPEYQEEASKSEECEVFLIELLQSAGEPIKPKDVLELAEIEGFNQRMVYRCRKKLDGLIRDTHGRFDARNCWALCEPEEDEEADFTPT